jgi:hypothetical protein
VALGALGALGAAALALIWSQRQEIAERWLLAQLARRGAVPASLRVTHVDARGMQVADLAVGPRDAADLAVAQLDVDWSLAGLRANRLDALRARGVRLRGAQDATPRFGAAEALWSGRADGDGAAGPPVLPVRELALHDAALAFTTPDGPLSGELDGVLRAGADGSLAGDLTLALSHPTAHAQGKVALSGTLADLAGELELSLRDAREPARVAPAELRGRVSGSASALHFDLALEGADGRLHLEARGDADPAERSGKAELTLAPLTFEPAGLQPATLLPALEGWLKRSGLEQLRGRIEAHGSLEVAEAVPALRLNVGLRNVGFATRNAHVTGLAGALALRAPRWRTPKGQKLTIERLEAGVPLTDGALQLQLREGGELALERARFAFVGGELLAENALLALGERPSELRLEARGLELEQLLALLSLESVQGSGRIDGELPVLRREGVLRVEGGVLRARPEGGVLRYRPTEAVANFAAARPNDLGIAVAALSDFHYEFLEVRLSGEITGALQAELHLRGKNPGYRDGHPVELNLTLDAEVADLVRSGQSGRVPRVVEERLRELTNEEKR